METNKEQYFKVKANKAQLEDFGISYDINGLVGKLIQKYWTGWYQLEITHKIGNMSFTNNFDIPKTFLKEVSIVKVVSK